MDPYLLEYQMLTKYIGIDEIMKPQSKKLSIEYFRDNMISCIKKDFKNNNPLIDHNYINCLQYLQNKNGIIKIENGKVDDNGFSNFLNDLYIDVVTDIDKQYDSCYNLETIFKNLIEKFGSNNEYFEAISMILKFVKYLTKYKYKHKTKKNHIINYLSKNEQSLLYRSLISHNNFDDLQMEKEYFKENEYLLIIDYICDKNICIDTSEQTEIESLNLQLLKKIRKTCLPFQNSYQHKIKSMILHNIVKKGKVSDFVDYFSKNVNKYCSNNYKSLLFLSIYIYILEIENNNMDNVKKLLYTCSQIHLRYLYFYYHRHHDNNKSLNFVEKFIIHSYFPKNFFPNKNMFVVLKQTKSELFLQEIEKQFSFDCSKIYSDTRYLKQKVKFYFFFEYRKYNIPY